MNNKSERQQNKSKKDFIAKLLFHIASVEYSKPR